METIALWVGYIIMGCGGGLLALWLLYQLLEMLLSLACKTIEVIGNLFIPLKLIVRMAYHIKRRAREAKLQAKRRKQPLPLRCRLGWHKWQATAFNDDFRYECERCGLQDELAND